MCLSARMVDEVVAGAVKIISVDAENEAAYYSSLKYETDVSYSRHARCRNIAIRVCIPDFN